MLYVIDFETYWSDDFTLSKLTTTEYVRDNRFKVQGVGVIAEGKEPVWVTENIAEYLRSLDLEHNEVLCHNTLYDGFILSETYGIHPKFFYDTMGMSKSLFPKSDSHSLDALSRRLGLPTVKGELNTKNKSSLTAQELHELGEYCKMDCLLTIGCFMKLTPLVHQSEFEVMDLAIKMFTKPLLKVNRTLALVLKDSEIENKQLLLNDLGTTAKVIGSTNQFCALMESVGVDVPKKWSEKQKKLIPALAKSDEFFLELLSDPIAKPYVEARLAVKSNLVKTRADRLLRHSENGKSLPVMLKYFGAHTGRFSGGDKLNLQNLPSYRMTKGNKGLRHCVVPPLGYAIALVDSEQIEARILAWFAEQWDLLKVFKSNGDPYLRMAENLYGRKLSRPDNDLERQVGKATILGCGYRMGKKRLIASVKSATKNKVILSEEQAEQYINEYIQSNRAISALWIILDRWIANGNGGKYPVMFENGALHLPNGTKIHYPQLHYNSEQRSWMFRYSRTSKTTGTIPYLGNEHHFRRIHGGSLTENIIQALARVIVTNQMLEIAKLYPVVSMTHDDIMVVVPINEADEAVKNMTEIMTHAPDWGKGIPLSASGGWGLSYGDVK